MNKQLIHPSVYWFNHRLFDWFSDCFIGHREDMKRGISSRETPWRKRTHWQFRHLSRSNLLYPLGTPDLFCLSSPVPSCSVFSLSRPPVRHPDTETLCAGEEKREPLFWSILFLSLSPLLFSLFVFSFHLFSIRVSFCSSYVHFALSLHVVRVL